MSTSIDQKSPLRYLFGKTKRGILEMLFGQPNSTFYTNEIVRHVGTGTGAVQKELKGLTAAGLATREEKGNLVLYKANPESPVFQELRTMMTKAPPASSGLKTGLKHYQLNVSQEKLSEFCRRNNIKKLSIFGTISGEKFSPGNGIEVLLEFGPGHEPGDFEAAELEEQLSSLSGNKVNIHSAAGMIEFAREEAMRTGVVIWPGKG